MHKLEHKVPPPILVLIVAIAMWLLARLSPPLPLGLPLRLVSAGVLMASGAVFTASGFLAFRRAKTTINPNNPSLASAIVSDGIYRFTRNPMYVGFTIMLIGFAAFLATPWALLGPLAFVLYLTRFQILPEERALQLKFGGEYERYQANVRRWL